MKKVLFGILVTLSCKAMATQHASACDHWSAWSQPMCRRLQAIVNEGSNDMYLTAYAWHNRYTYRPEKIRSFNENAWGGGFGKGMYDENGNWHGLYFITFMDSHNHVEPLGGYSWQKIFRATENLRFGAGFTIFATSRVDILDNFPILGVLPVATAGYKNITLNAIYIPGARGAGNVLFLLGRYSFDI